MNQHDMQTKMDNIMSMMRQGQENARKRIEDNKHIIFDIFDANGVAYANVRFDGSGDSGGVEEVSLCNKEHKSNPKFGALLSEPAPGVKILNCTRFSTNGWEEVFEEKTCTLNDALEGICYDALKAEHEGWENNDGAYGSLTLDSESRTIQMEYYERSTEFHEHEF